MPAVRQLPAKLDLECIAGDPFTVTITATGIATLTSPAVTMTSAAGDAFTTDPGIPTASVAGLAVTSAWSTADTAALNTGTRGKTYRYSVAANPDSAGLFEIVAGTLTVHPVGHAGTSSASSATLAVTVGTTAVSLAVALGGGGGGGGGGATTLNDLTDVTITAAASGDILRHNGTAWVDAVGTTHFEAAGAVAAAVASYLPLVAAGASVENVGAIESNVQTVAATGASETLDTAVYGVFDMTMDQNCIFTFSNPAPSGKATLFTLILRGAFTPTFPPSVDWANAAAPPYTTPAAYTFLTVDAGTTWLGTQAGRGFG